MSYRDEIIAKYRSGLVPKDSSAGERQKPRKTFKEVLRDLPRLMLYFLIQCIFWALKISYCVVMIALNIALVLAIRDGVQWFLGTGKKE